MEDQLISFETSKLVKEKGFKVECRRYNRIGRLYTDNSFIRSADFEFTFPAPTQSLLQKWLREIHNINVSSGYIPSESFNDNNYIYILNVKPNKDSIISEYYNLYEEALEVGLLEGLKLIK